ncbi:MAG: RluA family pseudouridine synthase [Clostridia bacterium]|nr:RluA family pseudouridine synthase [Clostridia bacterium]
MVRILFENKYLIVCVKPSGVLSQDDGKDSENMVKILSQYRHQKGEPDYIGIVHRLDRNVSGIRVFSKREDFTGKLSGALSDKTVTEKEYLAVLCGRPEKGSDTLTDLLFRDSRAGKTFVVDRKRAGVKEASLEYKVIAEKEHEGQALTLVRIKLHTGRTHQIRAQFSSRALPLAGDGKYGGRFCRETSNNIALCAAHLSVKAGKNAAFDLTALPDRMEFPWCLFERDTIENVFN